MTSRIPGFYRLTPTERLSALHEHAGLSDEDLHLYGEEHLDIQTANQMVENVVSTYALPNGVAVNLVINGEDRLVPMVVEEPSVVAAVSNMARLTRKNGGLQAESNPSLMIGQVQLVDVADPKACIAAIEAAIPELIVMTRSIHPRLIARGGGVRRMEARLVVYDEPGFPKEEMVVLHFVIDCVDAMGANMINTVAERLTPHLESITGARVGLRILSNLASERLARASCRLSPESLETPAMSGAEVAQAIAQAWRFAWADPYRAATHNKGVMNGIDAVAVATGNDWRAIEAGAHAWCARDGQYRPMTTWRVDDEGYLVGKIEVPMQFGTVGGPIRVHAKAQANLRMLGNRGARDLAGVAAAVGLVQNLGALRALATDGIQAGHMRMHARSVASSVGAAPTEIAQVVNALCDARDFSETYASQVLSTLREQAS